MSSRITIGRVGLDIDTEELDRWEQSGDTVSCSGTFLVASVAAAQAMRAQLLGLLGPDEPIVPVVWSDDTNLNGYYRVLDMQVGTDQFTLTNGLLSWSAKLQRFSAYPLVEMALRGGARTGMPGAITATGFHATPVSWQGVDYGTGTAQTPTARTTYAQGNLEIVTSTSSTTLNLVTAGVDPSDYYDAAASITSGGYSVVGRDMPNSTTSWGIGNGLIRFAQSSGAGNDLVMYVAKNDGSSEYGPFGLYWSIDGPVKTRTGTLRSVKILRNSPEECVIRLAYNYTTLPTSYLGSLIVDISVRRGSRIATITMSGSLSLQWGFFFETATALTGHRSNYTYRSTGTWADGRAVIGTGQSSTFETTQGGCYLTAAAAKFLGWIGIESLGASATTPPDGKQDLENQYWYGLSETQRVVAQ